nr:ribonuclease H-like domain-containing protein [Tanacetum cinerariifolium]
FRSQKAEITSLKAKRVGKPSSGTTKPANPNVIAPRMYTVSPKCLNFDSYDNLVFNSMNSGTRNHSKAKSSMSTTKTVRKPNVVTPKKPMWKPTGRHFTLYTSSPLTKILETIDEPVELAPSVSSNANLTRHPITCHVMSILQVVQIVLWYLDSGCSKHMTGYATRADFPHSKCGSSLFIYTQGSQVAYLLIYVDDIILTASSSALLQQIIDSLHKEFDMIDLGALNYFLGIFATRHYTGCPSTRRSTSGYCVFLGDNLLSWSSKQ